MLEIFSDICVKPSFPRFIVRSKIFGLISSVKSRSTFQIKFLHY